MMDSMQEKCKICDITIDEIKKLNEEEAHKINLSSDFCEKHMVAHLNVRKQTASVGKELLLRIKEDID